MARRSVGGLGAVLMLVAVAGCTTTATRTPATTSAPRTSAPRGAEGAPFSLYTHCGIHELMVDGRWYERVGGNLDDGHGNPPAGWGNPYQAGTLTRSGTNLVFRDQLGHEETFELRPGATSPKTICS
jgi:hypothetical protein